MIRLLRRRKPPTVCGWYGDRDETPTGVHQCHLGWWHWAFTPHAYDDPNLVVVRGEGWSRTEAEATAAWTELAVEYNRRRLGGYPQCSAWIIPAGPWPDDRQCTNPGTVNGLCRGHAAQTPGYDPGYLPPGETVPTLGPER